MMDCGNNTRSGQAVGSAIGFPVQFQTRGAAPVPFNGVLASGEMAEACEYTVRVRALHIYGDETNEDEWDEAVSQPFRIQYAG